MPGHSIGTLPEDQVARNIATLREQRRLTVRTLSALLNELGRPILSSGISKIENRRRSVDVGDLVALAIALRVNPNRLLFPTGDPDDEVSLTPGLLRSQAAIWYWALGEHVFMPEPTGAVEEYGSALDASMAFRRSSVPPYMRRHEEHTAVRAAQDLTRMIGDLLTQRAAEGRPQTGVRRAKATPEGVRRTLRRVIAEIEALIGEGDDEEEGHM